MATSLPVNRLNNSKGKSSGQKIEKDKPRWDPIPISYTELFPKLVRSGHIRLVQFAPLRTPFPRWYNAHTRYDYHGENLGHPTENCTTLKYKVRDLINNEKLKFEDLDRPIEVEDSSRTKVEMPRQKEETPKKVNFGKATMPKERVPIAKVGSSSTTEGSKEWSYEPNTEEEEKKVLQELVKGLERMFVKQNECVTTPKKEHNSRTLKQRQILGSDEA